MFIIKLTEFDLQISGIGSDHSVNEAKTNTPPKKKNVLIQKQIGTRKSSAKLSLKTRLIRG